MCAGKGRSSRASRVRCCGRTAAHWPRRRSPAAEGPSPLPMAARRAQASLLHLLIHPVFLYRAGRLCSAGGGAALRVRLRRGGPQPGPPRAAAAPERVLQELHAAVHSGRGAQPVGGLPGAAVQQVVLTGVRVLLVVAARVCELYCESVGWRWGLRSQPNRNRAVAVAATAGGCWGGQVAPEEKAAGCLCSGPASTPWRPTRTRCRRSSGGCGASKR